MPVEASASKAKLREMIEFAQAHDDVAKEIAENGYNFVWNNLGMGQVVCYWRRQLRRYAKLLRYKPVRDEGLMAIFGK